MKMWNPLVMTLILLPHISLCGFCDKLKNGVYHDSTRKSCQNYIRCQYGITVHIACSHWQYFNETVAGCIDPPDFTCQRKTGFHSKVLPGMKCKIPGKVFPSSFSCAEFLLCLNGTLISLPCPPKWLFNVKTWSCAMPPEPCDPNEQAKIHPRYQSSLGKSSSELRPMPKMAFHREDEVGPYAHICSDKRYDNGHPLIPDPYYCDTFLRCKDVEAKDHPVLQSYQCPPDQLFDAFCSECRRSNEVSCGQRYRNIEVHSTDPVKPNVTCTPKAQFSESSVNLRQQTSTPGNGEATPADFVVRECLICKLVDNFLQSQDDEIGAESGLPNILRRVDEAIRKYSPEMDFSELQSVTFTFGKELSGSDQVDDDGQPYALSDLQ